MALPSFTKISRQTTYPTIDPSRPELSAQEKTVIVTGGALAATVALSFAQAGARKIALVGPLEHTLQKTKDSIVQTYPDAEILVTVADISKAESVGLAAHTIRTYLGAWDVFAHCTTFMPETTTITGADEDDWWKAFEVNAKFSCLFAKHFVPKCRPHATYIGLNTGACHVRAADMPKNSAYAASKLAMAKLDEYLAEENPKLRVFTLHAGITASEGSPMSLSNGEDCPSDFVIDDAELPANFMVWLASPEAEFLKSGRFLWANWDVDELIARKTEIEHDHSLFRITIGGWPFQQTTPGT